MKHSLQEVFTLRLNWSCRFGLMLLLLVFAATPILAAGQDGEKTSVAKSLTTATPAPAPVAEIQTFPPAAIPAADIATKATEVTDLLRCIIFAATHIGCRIAHRHSCGNLVPT